MTETKNLIIKFVIQYCVLMNAVNSEDINKIERISKILNYVYGIIEIIGYLSYLVYLVYWISTWTMYSPFAGEGRMLCTPAVPVLTLIVLLCLKIHAIRTNDNSLLGKLIN